MSLDTNNAHFDKDPPKQQMRDGVSLLWLVKVFSGYYDSR